MGLILEGKLHPKLVGLFIALGPGSTNAGTFAGVEHSHLNGGGVGVQGHLAAEGVDLPDDVSFSQSTNRRVTAHLPNAVQIHG